MQSKPVAHTLAPRYPTRREFLAGASTLAVALVGCHAKRSEAEAEGIVVAPLFEHGTGRGVAGCVVVSPPVFLSEEEALQILREELGKQGIKLLAGATLDDVHIAPLTSEDDDDGEPFELDGKDAAKKVAVAFVSAEDSLALGTGGPCGTIQGYEPKRAAHYLAEQVQQQGEERLFCGVFYDPLTDQPPLERLPENHTDAQFEAALKTAEEKGKIESKKQLRAQAADFVAWLKKQRAIP